ncbi:hypothetical protein EYR41_011068 [Orbilia oligospora]|uniref:Uncharacterized protein n=1 Tax=Orbilia oligospora TaxID=2813651 RepID=A0A7C8KVN3_ORBOL|nr:hypothetical protein TWF751_003513 [Orbilia oligospora]KAF3287957.1 hypothetical protein TWF132_008199 [Orbilia oligospora]TGJ63125.1 hypothetical protein EYR41_011068 [Orbilia oligospora]
MRSTTTKPADVDTPKASQNALQIPEILESIIIWSLHLHYVYDDRCRRVNQLRRVAKVWQSTIDHNPVLRCFAFRDPLNTSSASASSPSQKTTPTTPSPPPPPPRFSLAIFCRPYCTALEYELAAVTEIACSHSKPIGQSEFQKVLHSITMTHSPIIKGFRKKRKVPRCLASNIFVTGPTVESIYLRFSGSADSDWLEALRKFAKPTDYVFNLFNNFEYDYHVESEEGVRGNDLVNAVGKAVGSFYELSGKGEGKDASFLIQKIEVWIGNPVLLKERPQSIPGWQIRTLWESKPWKIRDQPWYRAINKGISSTKSAIKEVIWRLIYIMGEVVYILYVYVVEYWYIVMAPFCFCKWCYRWVRDKLRN